MISCYLGCNMYRICGIIGLVVLTSSSSGGSLSAAAHAEDISPSVLPISLDGTRHRATDLIEFLRSGA
jgi:hypothetical protein